MLEISLLSQNQTYWPIQMTFWNFPSYMGCLIKSVHGLLINIKMSFFCLFAGMRLLFLHYRVCFSSAWSKFASCKPVYKLSHIY